MYIYKKGDLYYPYLQTTTATGKNSYMRFVWKYSNVEDLLHRGAITNDDHLTFFSSFNNNTIQPMPFNNDCEKHPKRIYMYVFFAGHCQHVAVRARMVLSSRS